MRATLALLVSLTATAPAQVWEKPIAPGLNYRMEVDPKGPLAIHILRFSPQSPAVRARPELGTEVVYRDDAAKGRRTLSQMVQQKGALAGINGDFFPFTGDPLGLMVREGELLSLPGGSRAVLAWGPQQVAMGTGKFEGKLTLGTQSVPIDGFNEECPDNGITLNTPAAGLALSKAPNRVAIVRFENAIWSPSANLAGTVESVAANQERVPVAKDRAVIVARGNKADLLRGIKAGDRIEVALNTSGFDWTQLENAVGGGPVLVREGKPRVSWREEGFKADFAQNRHPRTAVGRTRAGEIVFVAVDGRQPQSVGMTLDELAATMVRLECLDAINLDGGGSTTLNLLGVTVNRPSAGEERAVANGILFFGPREIERRAGLRLDGPASLAGGTAGEFRVLDAQGAVVDNAQVIWGATGPAWIDQGGRLSILNRGKVTVLARVGGQTLTREVTAIPAPAPGPKPGNPGPPRP